MHFLFTLNEAYAAHLAATLVSILRSQNQEHNLVFHIIHSDITPQTEHKLISLRSIRQFDIKFYKASEVGLDLSDFKITMPHISVETYYRLFAQDVLTDIKKVIHLDVDLLVLRDLTFLWELPLDNYYMTGTRCPVVIADYLNPLGCNFVKNPYYQAGVNVLNLDKMRNNGVSQRVHNIVKKFMPLLKRQDQDILNIISEGNVFDTPISYNFATVFLSDKNVRYRLRNDHAYIEALKSPHVVHFSRSLKPWHDLSRHPYKSLYWDYLKLTPWKENKPQPYSFMRLFKQELSPVLFILLKSIYKRCVPECVKLGVDKLYYKAIVWKLKQNGKNRYEGLKSGDFVYSMIKESNPAFLYFFKMTGLKPVLHPNNCDAIVLWGTKFFGKHFFVLLQSFIYRKPLVMAEDSFVRSIDIAERKEPGLSCIMDHVGLYYDYRQGSVIDRFLNSSWQINEDQKLYARQCMDSLLSLHISKYNLVPATKLTFNNLNEYNSVILVIDQRKGDQSVGRSGANESTFKKMLSDALNENPDSLILVKTHPDEQHGGFKGYYSGFKPVNPNVRILCETLNPISLLEAVDRVYVVSSQMGMEALICGKEVMCYGSPFYSGWGLTTDRGEKRERCKERDIVELFYASYIHFANYYNPEEEASCDLKTVINYISIKMSSTHN